MVILFSFFKIEAFTLCLFLQGSDLSKVLEVGGFQEIVGALLISLAQQLI